MAFQEKILLLIAAAALPALTLFYLHAEKRKRRGLADFAAAPLIEDLTASYSRRKSALKAGLLIIGTTLVLIAMARPQWGYDWQETKGKGIDILIALDTSKSMLAEDIKPNRLERAKLAVLDLLDHLEGDRIGLIAFSGNAFLQCPLTLDYDAYRQTLETVDTSIISRGGTNIAAAIAEAEVSFAKKENFKILVLITDGEDLERSGVEEARKAARAEVKIYTVGVGSPEGELIPVPQENGGIDFLRDGDGNVVKTRLDESTLNEISSLTGGFYTPLDATGEGLEKVYELGLQAIPKQEREARLHKIPHERFQWPLALALAALILETFLTTRRRKFFQRSLLPLFCAGFILLPSAPASASPQKAEKLYAEGDFSGARENYEKAIEKSPEDARLHYNLGASQYREGDFKEAETTLRKSLQSDDPNLQENTFYNLGNTHYRLGQATLQSDPRATREAWEKGLEDYENALRLDPRDEDAKFNREFLKKKLEELKNRQRNQQNEQKKDQDDQKKEENKNQDRQKDDQKDQPQNQQARDKQGEQQKDKEAQQDRKKQDQPQKDKEEEKANPSKPGEEGPESGKEKNPPPQRIAGRMTREEASQMLESMKEEEKKLPLTILEMEEEKRGGERNLKDW